MNTNDYNLDIIGEWLEQNNREIDFSKELTLDLLYSMVGKFKAYNGISNTVRYQAYRKELNFINRNLLKLLYIKNNTKASGIKEGFVYAISNPAWPGHIKVGSSIDVYDRLKTYQTSSPYRDFVLEKYVFTLDRFEFERLIQSKFKSKGEWVECNKNELFDLMDEVHHKISDEELSNIVRNDIISQLSVSPDILCIEDDSQCLKRLFVKYLPQLLTCHDDRFMMKELISIATIKNNWKKINIDTAGNITKITYEHTLLNMRGIITYSGKIKSKVDLDIDHAYLYNLVYDIQ